MAKRYNNTNNNYKGKSGCRVYQDIDNSKGLFIGGWKIVDGQKANITIFMTEKQVKKGIIKSKSGKEWVGVLMKVTIPTKPTSFCYGLMNLVNKKCYFKDWNWIANPNANNGGYIGKHISKNYNN